MSSRYRRHLLAKKVVTPAEMDEVWPTDDATLKARIECYGQLRAWLWVQDDVPSARDNAEERVLKALREAPESVVLSDGSRIHVYPKGLDTLLWFRDRQRFVSDLNRRTNAIVERLAEGRDLPKEITREPVRTTARAAHELAYQLALMAAVACEPGARLPKWVDGEARPPAFRVLRWPWRVKAWLARDPVAPFIDMDPMDMLLVHRAFMEVNQGRMAALRYVAPPRKPSATQGEMSYDVFLSTLAMKTGADPEYLAKDRSIVSLVSQVRLAQPPDLEEALE